MKLSLVRVVAPASLLALAALVGCASQSATRVAPEVPKLTSAELSARTAPPVDPSAPGLLGDPDYKPDTDENGPVDDSVAIDDWSKRYPDAAVELHDWMGHYPDTARRFATWDTSEPVRMRALVDWAVTHRYEAIGAFLYGRSGWSSFVDIVTSDPDGAIELVEWIRRSAPAAEELSAHPEALAWARKNLKVRPAHVPMAAKSVALPGEAAAAALASTPAKAPGPIKAPAGLRRPADVSPWFPTPGSVIR